MAVRTHGKSHRVLMPRTVHPAYRKVVRTITRNQQVEIVELDYARDSGATQVETAAALAGDFAALVIPQPNFFGVLEDADALIDWAHSRGALAIGVVNPLSLALLKPPGEWGTQTTGAAPDAGSAAGTDIAVGDGQPFGAPLSGGGPYFGFMCAKQALVRQMPGRIVGRTVDSEGRPGFCLTLQPREQHIRRAKATSNICTNQSLAAIAATIHLALLGPRGLERTAAQCHANTVALRNRLAAIPGVAAVFSGAVFHEVALTLPRPVAPVLTRLRAERILGGFDLAPDYPKLGNALLVCATETKTGDDIERFARALERALKEEAA